MDKNEIERFLNSDDFAFLKNFVYANYNGNKPPLDEILETICLRGGVSFESNEKFLQDIRDHLRQKISNQIGISDNNVTFPELTKNSVQKAEKDRAMLLETFKRFGDDKFVFDDVNSAYIDYKIVYDELSKCSPQKIAFIMNEINKKRKELIDYHQQEISKNPSPEKIEMHKNLIDFYQGSIYDSALPILFKSTEIGNFVTSNPIERNVPETINSDLKKLQFISNLLESIRIGYYDDGYVFDGSKLKSYEYGQLPSIVLDPKKSEIVSNLSQFDMSTNYLNQTRLAFDESTAKFLIERKKYPISRHIMSDQEKDITIELSSINEFYKTSPTDLVFPIFIKYKQFNKDSNTFTISLYVFMDDNINHGTQLYRIDKVNQFFRGKPAPHKQLGGEVLETYQHIHEYNLLNQLLNNDRKRGHFDVSQNMITMFALDKDTLEMIFDNKTNVPNEMDFEITNQIVNNFNQRGE